MLIRTPEQDIERVLFTEKAIAARVEQLGAELTEQLGDKRPVLVCVLKGAAFVRVHDVKENLRAIRMTQAILHDGRNG